MSDSSIPPYVLRLDVPGADAAQIAAGLAAAKAVLNRAGVDPAQAYEAYVTRASWRRTGSEQLSDEQLQNAALFTGAQLAALDRAIGVGVEPPEGSRLFVGLILD